MDDHASKEVISASANPIGQSVLADKLSKPVSAYEITQERPGEMLIEDNTVKRPDEKQ